MEYKICHAHISLGDTKLSSITIAEDSHDDIANEGKDETQRDHPNFKKVNTQFESNEHSCCFWLVLPAQDAPEICCNEC